MGFDRIVGRRLGLILTIIYAHISEYCDIVEGKTPFTQCRITLDSLQKVHRVVVFTLDRYSF